MLGHSRIIENDINERIKTLAIGRIKQKNVEIFAGGRDLSRRTKNGFTH